MKISFINAVACVCENVGADIAEVCRGLGSDSRIGSRFLNPGLGYGGSCFPKDLRAFRSVATEFGYDFRLLDEIMSINEDQVRRFVRKVRSALWNLRGKRIAVLGLAFKGGTDDVRESPALAVIRELRREGCEIVAYDPAAVNRAKEVLPAGFVLYAKNAYEAADGVDALLLLTDWDEFRSLDIVELRARLRLPIVIDGRNLLDPNRMADSSFQYWSIGRSTVAPKRVATARAVCVSTGAEVNQAGD